MSAKKIPVCGELFESMGSVAVKATRLQGGVRDGVLVVDLIAGDTRVVLLPDRGLGIWKIFSGDLELGWRSPIRGPVHPRFVPLGEPSGNGWLEGFDELLARCGLVSNGEPDFADNGRLLHGLHGRIANQPAQDVTVTLDDTAGTVSLSGNVDETRFLAHSLRMTTKLTVHGDRRRVSWTDEVENLSECATTMQMLYHVNFGPPLLGAGTEFLADVEELAPCNLAAVADLPTWQRYAAPQSGRGAQVHFMKLRPSNAGRASALIVGPDGKNAARLSWRAAELPCFTLWKNQGGLADGYVTGLEPGTNYPNPRSFEESQGRVVRLAPRSRVSFDLAIEHLPEPEIIAVRACLTAGNRPYVNTQPRSGWSMPQQRVVST